MTSSGGRPSRIRMVATDLDGTLLRPDGTIGARTRAALDRVRAAGVLVVPVTARQPIGLADLVASAGFDDWALCSNGALSWHVQTGEVGFATTLDPGVQAELARALTAVRPGVRFASVHGHAAEGFLAQEGYPELARFSDHKRDPATMPTGSLAEVTSFPALKLVGREPDASPQQTLTALDDLGLEGFTATRSGAPFIEIAHPEVSKASGLTRLCADLDIAREEVVAFGDAPNDVEMLAWAGIGIAMADADPAAKEAADVTLRGTNAQESVAQWLDSSTRWRSLGER